jgi:chromosomal replication initiation ATPase DnaA
MADSRCIGEGCFIEQALLRAETKLTRQYSVKEVVAAVCDAYGVGMERVRSGGSLAAEIRGVMALLVLELHGCCLAALAPEVGRDPSSLSSAARRISERAERDDKLANKIRDLGHKIAALQA